MDKIDFTGREYKLIYGDDGKVSTINLDNSYIPLDEGNRDYQEFLEWNKTQRTPLDLKSTIKIEARKDPTKEELFSELNSLIERAKQIEITLSKKEVSRG